MHVLAIDTSTQDLVTGLVGPDDTVDKVIVGTRAHNELLIPTIEELLAVAGLNYAALDAVVVGCGPGPFTGLRVGMSTAQALGVALEIPVHGVCSLDAIAHGSQGELLVATDARRKEVYWATYRDGRRVSGPDVTKPAELKQQAQAVVFPAHIEPPEHLAGLPRTEISPRAAGLVACAALDQQPEPLVPLYLRRPDAVPPKAKPVSPALTWDK
ncbi:peptidase M22 [Corynebacterium phocae]|uniref:Peptidase M22 n=1 Tax=Corynebacterium phocae TaxID=161895 RepID=A0A1L7D5H9_9CORY|nr:tRNA (adenosine(37)-N6)-threonylcarbamoyltransferase complex dimerization subunit type 1 TsaB [Corynebacterium phocae]APT93192.1 peptidase M22 [Corynebacterium phocae]KAA8721928.1 tRNA (adenosine(37)-N6)-threonylcarbamoyltransferase complex dimerization subunit type 1 TsaB [Corynebacterium phocae]